MTMPAQPAQPTGNGGLLGGITGTLGGTNSLQSSIDQLTNSVNRLTQALGSLQTGGGGPGRQQYGNGGGGGGGGFPPMQNPFQPQGSGSGGWNNTSPIRTFSSMGAIAGGFAMYGQQQFPVQLGLNAYATTSQLGMNTMNGGYASQQLMTQAFGMYNRNLNALASGPMDALAMTQGLQYAAGNPMYMQSGLGRSAYGIASSSILTNPLLSGAQGAGLAQALMSPQFSRNMLAAGYNITPRRLGGGTPNNIGPVVQSWFQAWYGKNRVQPSTLAAGLGQGGLANIDLQGLGLTQQQINQLTPMIEGYNKLFNQGMSATAASNLFSTAGKNTPAGRAAQAQLARMHIAPVASDIQKLRNNQSVVTGRAADVAGGFNSALTNATDTLQKFNLQLSSFMTNFGLNGPIGGMGGLTGVLSGTNHGPASLIGGGLAGLLLGRGLMGGGGAAGGLLARLGLGGGGAGGAAAGGAGGLGSILGGAAMFLPALFGAGMLTHNTMTSHGSSLHTGNPLKDAWGVISDFFQGVLFKNMAGGSRSTVQSVQGGAASMIPGGSQKPTGQQTGSSLGGGVTAQAKAAVGAAEKELGVPYVWGGESPGIGFDCSGLVQWAYRQAGVNLPRTSQQQWAALKNRSVALNQVQEGDLVFMAGSDGTAMAPGHVGMMINKHQLIQAPFTGADVQIIAYNPGAWQHAARPSGRGGMGGSANNKNSASPINSGGSSVSGIQGNRGQTTGVGGTAASGGSSAGGLGGSFGSVNEADIINAMGSGITGSSAQFNQGSASANNAGLGTPSTMTGGSVASRLTGKGTGPSPNLGGIKNPGGQSVATDIKLGQQLAAKFGWTGAEWNALLKLWMGESGWKWWQPNLAGSGAYGIPQALPANKMGDIAQGGGPDWKTNPVTQIRWGLNYIKGRYGDPVNAYNTWLSRSPHWYAGGTLSGRSGIQIVGERGPELQFSGGGNTILDNAQTMKLLKAVSAEPAQSPWKVMGNEQATLTSQKQSTGDVHLNFGQNAIVINMPLGSTSSTAASAKEMTNQFVTQLAQRNVMDAIKQGRKG